MNEIIINVISVLVTTVVLPLITYLGIRLNQYLTSKIKDEKAKKLLTNITDIITSNVASVFQTYVEGLKKEGKFDKQAQTNALRFAKEQVLANLSADAIDFISENYGDINQWITTQIESTIYALKK